jgi:hypothetical protein
LLKFNIIINQNILQAHIQHKQRTGYSYSQDNVPNWIDRVEAFAIAGLHLLIGSKLTSIAKTLRLRRIKQFAI